MQQYGNYINNILIVFLQDCRLNKGLLSKFFIMMDLFELGIYSSNSKTSKSVK